MGSAVVRGLWPALGGWRQKGGHSRQQEQGDGGRSRMACFWNSLLGEEVCLSAGRSFCLESEDQTRFLMAEQCFGENHLEGMWGVDWWGQPRSPGEGPPGLKRDEREAALRRTG